MRKIPPYLLLFSALVLLSDCSKQEIINNGWSLDLDAPTHYVTLGETDTVYYDITSGYEDYVAAGGVVQMHPDEDNGFTVTGSGDGWFTVVVNSPGIHTGKVYRLLNTTTNYKKIKFIVNSHKIIYSKKPTGGAPDIYIRNEDGSSDMNVTNTPATSEHDPTISTDGTMYGYADDHSFSIIRNFTDTMYSQSYLSYHPINLHFIRDETGFTVLYDAISGVRAYSLDPIGTAMGISYQYQTVTYKSWFVNANSLVSPSYPEFTYIETYTSTYLNNVPSNADYKLRQTGSNASTSILTVPYPSTVSYAEISPNGKYLVYAASGTSSPNHIIYLINRTSPNTHIQLTDGSTDCDHPTFSPDNKEIIYSGSDGTQYDLYRVNIDGTSVRNITNTATFDEKEPEWR